VQPLRDSIHRNIELEPWALELIDTREMQRLRRIRQLGTAYLVYPGANHTRFEHSLGAYKLARDAARALGLSVDDSRALAAAALLHDLGHGPMSHLFEEVLREHNQRHEEFSIDLIQWSTIGDLLSRHGIEPKVVADFVLGRGAFGRVVAGDIDVDRMDYLLRDAHYTGVRTAVDPERLLSVMALVDGEYVVREAGLTAVESLLVTRFLMYPSVYFHHTCRAAEAMVVSGIEALLAQGAQLEELRFLDDEGLMARLRAGPPEAADVARRIEDRRLYKRAFEGSHAQAEAVPELAAAREDAKGRRRLRDMIAHEAGVPVHSVLLDIPRPPLMREVRARVLRRDGGLAPVAEASTLIRTLMAAQMDHWRFWVFAPTRHLDAVRSAASRVLGTPKKVKPDALIGRPE
jgi:uncharacterized protein